MNSRLRDSKGFTLLELVIALAIFSIAALVALKHSSQSVVQQSRLVDRTLALWVAENAIAELRLKTPWPATGSKSTTVNNANRHWDVSVEVSATALETLRKITVTVQRENDQRVLASLTGYLGQH